MIRARMFLLTAAASLVVAVASVALSGGSAAQASCKGVKPGEYISDIARNVGHSGDLNPGNAHNPTPPFVPFVLGCNPNA